MKDSIAPDDAGTETRTADVDFFGYRQYPRIVYFGHGCRSRLGEVLAELGCERPAVLLSPSQRDFWEELQRSASLVPVVLVEHDLPHVPIRSRDEVATQAAARDADVLICLGGGSVTGLAKAVATQTGLPYVALPTTYAGSEMTDFFGTSDGGKKQVTSPLAPRREPSSTTLSSPARCRPGLPAAAA